MTLFPFELPAEEDSDIVAPDGLLLVHGELVPTSDWRLVDALIPRPRGGVPRRQGPSA